MRLDQVIENALGEGFASLVGDDVEVIEHEHDASCHVIHSPKKAGRFRPARFSPLQAPLFGGDAFAFGSLRFLAGVGQHDRAEHA